MRDFVQIQGQGVKLRDVLTIRFIRETQDQQTGREDEEEPKTFAVVRGNIVPLDGRELYTAQQVQPQATHEAQMRYLPGLTSKMEIDSKIWGTTFRLLEPPRSFVDGPRYFQKFLVREEEST